MANSAAAKIRDEAISTVRRALAYNQEAESAFEYLVLLLNGFEHKEPPAAVFDYFRRLHYG